MCRMYPILSIEAWTRALSIHEGTSQDSCVVVAERQLLEHASSKGLQGPTERNTSFRDEAGLGLDLFSDVIHFVLGHEKYDGVL